MITDASHFGSGSHMRVSKHAAIRQQQRGIRTAEMQFVLSHADLEQSVGDGKVKISISRKRSKRLVRHGWPPSLVDASCKLELIVGDDDTVVSLYHIN